MYVGAALVSNNIGVVNLATNLLTYRGGPTTTSPPALASRRRCASACPSLDAWPWAWAARAAASNAGTPRAMKAPIMPERTSPVPAVASRESPAV